MFKQTSLEPFFWLASAVCSVWPVGDWAQSQDKLETFALVKAP